MFSTFIVLVSVRHGQEKSGREKGSEPIFSNFCFVLSCGFVASGHSTSLHKLKRCMSWSHFNKSAIKDLSLFFFS